jgi:hypothetical protein
MENKNIRKLDWDSNTGNPPKLGQIIENNLGIKYKVIKVSGNKITIEKIS